MEKQKQTCVALSTAEAEYVALSSSAQESLWLQQLLSGLTKQPAKSMIIYEDNQSAISMAKKPKFSWQIKTHCYQISFCEGASFKWTEL